MRQVTFLIADLSTIASSRPRSKHGVLLASLIQPIELRSSANRVEKASNAILAHTGSFAGGIGPQSDGSLGHPPNASNVVDATIWDTPRASTPMGEPHDGCANDWHLMHLMQPII